MEKGQIVTVTIEDMSGEGQGIGRADGALRSIVDTADGVAVSVKYAGKACFFKFVYSTREL